MDVIVIGGGASGLVSGIIAARKGAKVTIIERNLKCGKKILLTGNGRSNFWNQQMDVSYYHSSDINSFSKIFNSKKDEVLDFFKSLGIVPKINNGYYYPYSNQANSILNALLNELDLLNVKIETDEYVTDIIKKDKFYVYTNKKEYSASKVILATGSKAFPKTGSDGNGYLLAKKLGHTINTVLPSLVKLKGQENFYKEIKGVRCEVELSLYEDLKKVKSEIGEVLFTENGISGICTYNLSGIVSRGLKDKRKEEININFIPWFKGLEEGFKEYILKQSNHTIIQVLEGFLNYKIANLILKLTGIAAKAKITEINLDKIIDLLMNFKIEIIGTSDFSEAQVATGGIPLQEINPLTLESKKTKDLYLVGEILDVDGICGGYNLGFAWISGLLAGEGIFKND